MEKRITIRDIARETGVHFTTVSLALRNNPRLSEKTRTKIQKAAREMGYTKDPMVSALVAYRKQKMPVHHQATLAWINDWPDPEGLLAIREFREYLDGILERAHECGYLMEEIRTRSARMSPDKIRRILKARNIRGALLLPLYLRGEIPELPYDTLASITIGHSIQPANMDTVANHHAHTLRTILDRVLEKGYRRIAFWIPAEWDGKVENAWENEMVLLHHRRPDLPQLPRIREIWENFPKQDLTDWMNQNRPDVIISYQNVLDNLQEIGIRVPEDLGYVSPFLNRDEQTFTGIYQNNVQIGRIALDLLIDKIHRNDFGPPLSPTRTLVEGIWNEGETLPDKHP
ncbi:LacI family DNA-binding transcriptional regulator [Kiritimatiellaeota bacterium B1221]|nr:LacI family DNA-binding transcriptional regulator [Kiritimatiellaeota bacterium B1221]